MNVRKYWQNSETFKSIIASSLSSQILEKMKIDWYSSFTMKCAILLQYQIYQDYKHIHFAAILPLLKPLPCGTELTRFN